MLPFYICSCHKYIKFKIFRYL